MSKESAVRYLRSLTPAARDNLRAAMGQIDQDDKEIGQEVKVAAAAEVARLHVEKRDPEDVCLHLASLVVELRRENERLHDELDAACSDGHYLGCTHLGGLGA